MFEGETKKMKEKEKCSYWNAVFTEQYWTITTHGNGRNTLADINCHSLWPLPSQLGIALVRRQAQPRHLCLWACVPSIVCCNSRWGYRSATLQQNWLRLCLIFLSCQPPPHPSAILFSFLCPPGLNIYGLVKPTWNGELTDISSVKVLSERP